MTKRERQGAEYAQELREEQELALAKKYAKHFVEAALAIAKRYDPGAEVTPEELRVFLNDAHTIACGRMKEQ